MLPDHVTVTQEPDGLYHWQIVRLARGRITISRCAWRTYADAVLAAITIADCYRLPLAAELPVFISSSAEVTQ
ncbi:MAG TPA: hypothetical protein PL105_16025 [Caldilineaceae bacterium]|nr:hypothetical protein [Caldilineaceae bacterium]